MDDTKTGNKKEGNIAKQDVEILPEQQTPKPSQTSPLEKFKKATIVIHVSYFGKKFRKFK